MAPSAEKEAIIESIRHGTAAVQRTFGSLSEGQLQTRVHEGERGWTAKEVLAHLAARGPVNDLLLRMGAGESVPLAGATNMDERNQGLVDRRVSMSRDTLLTEFQEVQDALIALVRTSSEALLARPISLPQGELPLGDVLSLAGGRHAEQHAEEVQQALDRSTSRT